MLLLRSLSIYGIILLALITLAGCAGKSLTLQNNQDDTLTNTGADDTATDESLNVSIQEGFINTGKMIKPHRHMHTATLLPNGKVLIAGGQSDNETLSSALLYDPKGNNGKGIFTEIDNMSEPRFYHTATLLPNGKVMIVGGHNDRGTLNSVELYDPSDNNGMGSFTTLDITTIERRHMHSATLLPDGRVLIAGGWDRYNRSKWFRSAEMYDPKGNNGKGSFTVLSKMPTIHFGHTATLLPNGNVLIAGGLSDLGISPYAEIFEPTGNDGKGLFRSTNNMTTGSLAHTATLLPNGKVLIAGGENGSIGFFTRVELYDPNGNFGGGTFTNIGNLAMKRSGHSATLLPDGQILFTGGWVRERGLNYLNSAELYNPEGNNGAGSFTAIDNMNNAHYKHTATLLLNGNVLIAGGENDNDSLNNAELYVH